MRAACLVVVALAQLSYARQAFDLGRTHDDALFEAFSRGYELAASGTIDRAEVITEFRRAVMIVRDRAAQGDFQFTERDLEKAMVPWAGMVTVAVEARLHPLHVFAKAPAYDLYIETGRSSKPVGPKPFSRAPVFPPGLAPGTSMTGVRLEGTFERAPIAAAAAPMLVVVDDQANVIWKVRIDLARYR